MSIRSLAIAAAMGLVLINGCQPPGVGVVPGGGGGDFITPSPDLNTGGTIVPPTTDRAGTPVTLPPVNTSAPPLQPVPATPGVPAGGGGGVTPPTASPATDTGTSPAPFPAISPPPSPALGAVGGA